MQHPQSPKFAMVTSDTLVVGIDVAKSRHVARCCDERGQAIGKPLAFANNADGFNSLLAYLRNLQQIHRRNCLLVGMEPTGTYWLGIAYWLRRHEIPVVQVQSLHVHRSKELDDGSPTKNDTKDAQVIARLVADARFSDSELPSGPYAELRSLAIQRGALRAEITRLRCKIHSWLSKYFPEFEEVFDDPTGMAARIALTEFPMPEDVLRTGTTAVGERFRAATKGRVWHKHALGLYAAAQQSVGMTDGLRAGRLQIRQHMERLAFLQEQLAVVEAELLALFMTLPEAALILSLPGLSPVQAAVLVAEIGDLRRFRHPKQLQKMAGLALKEKSSGTKQGIKRITKRGRRRLRSVLYLIVLGLVSRDPVFKQFHARLVQRPTRPLAPKQSLVALCTKFLTILHAVVKHKRPYDPTRALPAQAA